MSISTISATDMFIASISISFAKVVLFSRICKPYVHLHTRQRWTYVKISGLDGGLYTGEINGIVFFLKHANFLDCIPKIRSIIWISTIKRTLVGFWWLLDCSQVDCGLGDHFATTVSYLWASCALSVAFYKHVSIIMVQKSSAFWCFGAEKSLAINRSNPLGEIRRL